MKRGTVLFLTVVATAFSQGDIVFRSDVSLVRVDAQVLDGSGRAVTGLVQRDFVLREQGQDREIRNFANENMPVDVLILVDVSTSMRPNVEKVAAASRDALDVLGRNDRVGMMVFDRATRLRLPFTAAHTAEVEGEFARLLNQEHFNGGTDITRALLDAATYVKRNGRQGVRRAVVILTDDQTEFNRDEPRVIRAMTEADAVVSLLLAPDMVGMFGGVPGGNGGGSYPGGGYPGGGGGTGTGTGGRVGGVLGDILLGGGRRGYPGGGYPGGGGGGRYPGGGGGGRYPGGGGGGYPRGGGGSHTQSAGTREIAARTGGDTIQIDDASAFETTLARIRQRYALYFTVPDGVRAGAERNITVELASSARRRYQDAEVRYRRTYIVPEGTAVSAQPGDPAPVVVTSSQSNRDGDSPSATSTSSSSSDGAIEESRPVIRRRTAVNERTGPSGPAAAPPPPQAAAKPASSTDTDTSSAAAQQQAQPAATTTTEKKGGWRRADPTDLKP